MSMQKRKFTKEEKLQILEGEQNQWGKKPPWRSSAIYPANILQLAEEI